MSFQRSSVGRAIPSPAHGSPGDTGLLAPVLHSAYHNPLDLRYGGSAGLGLPTHHGRRNTRAVLSLVPRITSLSEQPGGCFPRLHTPAHGPCTLELLTLRGSTHLISCAGKLANFGVILAGPSLISLTKEVKFSKRPQGA